MGKGTKQTALFIIPCDCQKYLGRLVTSAVLALGEKPGVHVYQPSPSLTEVLHNRDEVPHASRSIAVDGCEEQCVRKALNKLNLKAEFYLLLTDLGLEELEAVEITAEDLQLAMDGIEACATRVTGGLPQFPGCCC